MSRRYAQMVKPAPERPCDLCMGNISQTRWARPEGQRLCPTCERIMAEQAAVNEAWGIDADGNWLDDAGNITRHVRTGH